MRSSVICTLTAHGDLEMKQMFQLKHKLQIGLSYDSFFTGVTGCTEGDELESHHPLPLSAPTLLVIGCSE